jgi:hypothetical protein
MSLFGSLNTDDLEESEDRLGGFSIWESDIYTFKIKMAYAGESHKGARNVHLFLEAGGKEYRETIYVTNKNKENWFLSKDDKKKKVPLPGFTTIDDICLVTTNKPLADQDSEEKMVKVYDPELQKEIPKSVPVLTELLDQTVSLAISKNTENKNEADGNGNYVATAATRETNTIEKVFHTESQMTVAEARNGAEKPAFWTAWIERNKGKVRDKRSIKDGAAGQAGRPARAQNASPPQAGTPSGRKSLFAARA